MAVEPRNIEQVASCGQVNKLLQLQVHQNY
jgi:hypothetical protein